MCGAVSKGSIDNRQMPDRLWSRANCAKGRAGVRMCPSRVMLHSWRAVHQRSCHCVPRYSTVGVELLLTSSWKATLRSCRSVSRSVSSADSRKQAEQAGPQALQDQALVADQPEAVVQLRHARRTAGLRLQEPQRPALLRTWRCAWQREDSGKQLDIRCSVRGAKGAQSRQSATVCSKAGHWLSNPGSMHPISSAQSAHVRTCEDVHLLASVAVLALEDLHGHRLRIRSERVLCKHHLGRHALA